MRYDPMGQLDELCNDNLWTLTLVDFEPVNFCGNHVLLVHPPTLLPAPREISNRAGKIYQLIKINVFVSSSYILAAKNKLLYIHKLRQ